MGRWAQRQRRGGGPGTRPPPTITIDQIIIDDAGAGVVLVYFSAAIDAVDFAPADFFNQDIGASADLVVQDSANVLNVSAVAWGGLVNVGQIVTYSGSAPDVITPQSVAITP